MAFTPITLTGTFTEPDGSAVSGTGSATLSHRIANGTTIIEPTPIALELSPTGTVVNSAGQPLILEANDDPGTEPQGSFYSFVLEFGSAPIDPFEAVISHLAPGATVDLSALIPALP
jgi:hypothetical protein